MAQLKIRPALVIVDMQNGFCHEEGTFGLVLLFYTLQSSTEQLFDCFTSVDHTEGKMGLPVSGMRAVIPNISRLRSICHDLDVPVFYLKLGWNEDYSDSGILLEAPPASAVKDLHGLVRGTWDTAIVDELVPHPEKDIVIDKTRNSGFWGTDFAERLAKRRVEQLIIAGVGSNVCVECTARDSFQNGIYTITVSDATGTISDHAHNATMESLQWFGGTATTIEIEKALVALQQRS